MNTQTFPTARSTFAPLSHVMAYRHPSLIARFEDKLKLSRKEAEALFEDTKRFLYLCAHADGPMAPSEKIDDGWHNFLLFTKDYQEFCQRFFGRFIHHRPRYLDDPAPDPTLLYRTKEAARMEFGTLSANWEYIKATADCCEQCAGSTNCQT